MKKTSIQPAIYLIDTFDSGMLDSFHEQIAGVPAVTFDIETTGLSPIDHQISLIGLGVPAKSGFQCWVFDVQVEAKLAEALKGFWQGKQLKIGHNVKFDAGFLKQHTGSQPYPIFDTMLASQIIHNGRGSNYGHKLEDVVQRELKQTMLKDKRIQQSFKAGPYSREQLQYLADDLVAPWLVFPKLVEQLQNEELNWVNALELAALPALQEMELTGFAIDDESRVALQQSLEQQLEELTAQLPQIEKPAKGKKPATVEPLNINSHPQIKEYFQKTWRISLPDTKEETLVELARITGKPEAASLLNNITECRYLHKRLNTYVNHLQDKHRRSDGRVHGQFNPLGTVSGRISASNPNLQNIPRSAEFRKLYIPTEGEVFVICDYSQIELRICAELAGETRMIEAMQQGEDLHRMTAAKIFGVSEAEVTKEQRQQAKAVNFGLIYGMSPNRLVKEGIAKDQKQGAAIIKAFFELYPKIKRMHKYLEQQMGQAIQKDPTQLQIRTQGTNRRRWLSRKDVSFQDGALRPNTLFNQPVQGLAADGMKAALVVLKQRLERLDAELVAVIHDEVIVQTPLALADQVQVIVEQAMIDGMQTFVSAVPIIAEAVVGNSWAEK